jgi:CDP-glucose 4,6-dehydratase
MENLGINISIWNGKRVLVTGHTGFKGSWLTMWLKKKGAKVIGYSLENYPNDKLFNDCNLGEKIIDIRGDIRDSEKLKLLFEKYDPEFVFHLAAQPLVRESYNNPKETFETNIIGTINLLECIRNSNVSGAVIITTDKVYKNKEWIWGYRENDRLGGSDPYSSSKSCAELIVSSYKNSFLKKENKLIATARAGNVIGGGDWSKDRLVPDCIRSLINTQPIKIRNPKSTRPWQHVLEPLSGYILLGEKLLKKEKVDSEWNFGPKQELILPVKNIVEIMLEEWGSGEFHDLSNEQKNAPQEAGLLGLDISKAIFQLGWNPKLNIQETIRLTVNWYKNYNKINPYELCLKQIEDYERK